MRLCFEDSALEIFLGFFFREVLRGVLRKPCFERKQKMTGLNKEIRAEINIH